jgi:hypothetical protein
MHASTIEPSATDDLPRAAPAVSTLAVAGLLLAAIDQLRQFNLPRPTASEVIRAINVTRTQAYEHRQRILDTLPGLTRPVGRPPQLASDAPRQDTQVLTKEVLRFIGGHPGCMSTGKARNYYSTAFRLFILELRAKNALLDLPTFAEAIQVPVGTLEDWLRTPVPAPAPAPGSASDPAVMIPQLESLINAWHGWKGSFGDFCEHARTNLRVPHGRTWIASMLAGTGVRRPALRDGRTSDEEAIRDAFEKFFPGAQWVGDGLQLKLRINDESFAFNLELMVDPVSGARTGASIRDEEDGQAVIEAFKDGVETTGSPPLATLLDNRPSNHTDEVVAALGDAIRVRASPGRGQNKGHAEGSFGLFVQTVPELVLQASSSRELARQILALVVITWGRATNHLPRADRKNKSRVELYTESKPTADQIQAAKAALRERQQRQELIEQRRRARLDPVTRAMLDHAFDDLGLIDPDRHFRDAIAAHPLSAVLAGIAIFRGKRSARRLPDGVDARYLLGIVKNVAQDDEFMAISEALLQARLQARDLALAPLRAELASIRAGSSDTLDQIVDRAMSSTRQIDRLFWLDTVAADIAGSPDELKPDLIRRAARRIRAVYEVPYGQRLAALRHLQQKALPIAAD